LQRSTAGLRSVDFYFMSIMGLQHGTISIQGDVLAVLGDNPISAGLFETTTKDGLLSGLRRGCGTLVLIITGRSWLLLARYVGLGLRVLVLVCTPGIASGLRQSHAASQHKRE
jgi:hypothetical protein